MYSDVYNTEVNINGRNIYSATYYPGASCCCRGGYYMNSCFDYGFNNIGFMFGAGLGMTAFSLLSAFLNKNKY